MALNITGPQSGELSRAIESAYPNFMTLQQLLSEKLSDSIFNYAGFGSTYPDMRFNLIQQYNARYMIDALVVALVEGNPTNELLLQFAWQHECLARHGRSLKELDSTKAPPGKSPLERMLDPVRGFSDPIEFLKRMTQITRSVCRIAVPSPHGTSYGTGLLVGNRTVLTNFHVLESLIDQATGQPAANDQWQQTRFLFDYHTDETGQAVGAGVEFGLTQGETWLIDFSPYDANDLSMGTLEANVALPRAKDHLDYALVRLNKSPGSSGVGAKPVADGQKRGFIALPADVSNASTELVVGESALFLFQHPSKRSLQMDWEKPAVLAKSDEHSRVWYDLNTQPGSSGAPCFNAKLELVALHHAGGQGWPAAKEYLYNEGIPISAIVRLLSERKKMGEID